MVIQSPQDGGTDTGRAVLTAAINEANMGAGERLFNNSGVWVEKYLKSHKPLSWCAGFVSWCIENCGLPTQLTYSLSALDIRNQMRKLGYLYYDYPSQKSLDIKPEPGDIIVFERGTSADTFGHIGIVWGVENETLFTIEGNKTRAGKQLANVEMFDYPFPHIPDLLAMGRLPDQKGVSSSQLPPHKRGGL